MSLQPKVRTQMAIEHKQPDKVPYLADFVPELKILLSKKYKKELEKLNINHLINTWDLGIKLGILFGHDMIVEQFYGIQTGYYDESKSDAYIDKWGIKWKKSYYKARNGTGYYNEIADSPLKNDSEIDNYTPPNPEDEDLTHTDEIIKKYGKEYYICTTLCCSIFSSVKMLRGFTQSLIDLYQNKDIAHKIMDMSINYHLKLAYKLIDKGVDMLWFGDDVGAGDRLLMSPKVFREMIKPKIGYVIDKLKSKNKNIKIAYHSCGYILPFIDDFIEIGVDLLNPIQSAAMDPAYIKKRYGNNISLWGTVSTQKTLAFGSPEEVRKEVKERISTCGIGGGLILAPDHNFQLDVPLENIEAFYNGVKEYGEY